MVFTRSREGVCLGVAALALAAAGCATPTLDLPQGVGRILHGGGEEYFEARAECQHVLSLTAALDVHGTVGRRRVRSSLRAAVAAIGLVRLETARSDAPVVVTATDAAASIRLSRPHGALRPPLDRAIELAAGLPFSPIDVEHLLTGCPRLGGGLEAWMLGDTWMRVRVERSDDLYLRRAGVRAPWTLASLVRRLPGKTIRWRADFLRRAPGSSVPTLTRLTSLEWDGQPGRAFDLTIAASALQINPVLDPEVFAPPAREAIPAIPIETMQGLDPPLWRSR